MSLITFAGNIYCFILFFLWGWYHTIYCTKHNRCKSSEIWKTTMRYSTSCSICHKKFRTGRSLSSHMISRHHQDRQDTLTFSDEKGKIFVGPKPEEIPEKNRDGYLNWLSVLVDRVNGSLIPDYPGKLTFCFWSFIWLSALILPCCLTWHGLGIATWRFWELFLLYFLVHTLLHWRVYLLVSGKCFCC